MKKRNGIAAAIVAAMTITSSAAHAGDAGKVAGGVLLGVLGTLAVQNAKKPRASQQRSSVNSYQRQQNREVQAALNGFGFDAGTVDGQLGRRSRAAISNYQAYMGNQPTGYLNDYERGQLVSAHQKLQSGGGAAYPQVVANEGTRGLLKAFADPNYANRYRNNGGQLDNVQNNNGVVDRNLNNAYASQVPTPTPPPPQPLSIAPLGLPLGQAAASMANHCELVVGMTQANQGVVLASNVNDPDQALGEQFCEARAFAMTQSQGLLAQVRQPEEAVAAACGQIADALMPATSQIGTGDVKVVATQAQQIANGLFANGAAEAAGYGQICLGLGYRQDDPKIALGAATAMLAAGQIPYAEIMGHHLRWGFGATASPTASTAWYQTAITSMEQGAQPVFVPSKTAERNAIIKASLNAPLGGIAPLQQAGGGGLNLPPLNLGSN